MVQIKWLVEAKIDLKEIHDYIALDLKNLLKFKLEK